MRSLLFVPADSERKLAHSLKSGADALILDLEDSVVPANRPSARTQARAFLDETRSAGIARYVRINALVSDAALDDLTAVLPGKPEGILLPKCLPEELPTLDHYLSALEAAYGFTPGGIRVIAIATETPAAVLALSARGSGGMPIRRGGLLGSPGVQRIWRPVSAAAIAGTTGFMTMSTAWRGRCACWPPQQRVSCQSTLSLRTSRMRPVWLRNARQHDDRDSSPRWPSTHRRCR